MELRSFHPEKVDLNGQSVLITGGTGSFGKAFIHSLLERCRPGKIIVFSRDEAKQYEMELELRSRFPGPLPIRFFIGDVRDRERLELAVRDVDVVVHAAAMKHVPAAEYNPFECIKTNVYGAENIVRAALDQGIRKVIALSTDKAESPVNLYGASKLAADKIFVAANNLVGDRPTRFSVVRYGNVLGSRGSVLPFFRDLVNRGAREIPITDPRMTRFFITLRQGVDFVISSLGMMKGGEIFVPKIPSVKIVDLAAHVAPGIPHKVVGIRPGEKLHEVLISGDNARSTVEYPDRYVIEPALAFWQNGQYEELGARRVDEEFIYASHTNPEWLNGAGMTAMLKAC
ncbi:MAG: UDP-N-acetylglucosamine 4,6-dehydratase (inverting) [Pseudorhodoplanes sp.]|nr:MAG: UDP-N-acetylglucosamine 4,6-dehydratase (inverting) [Pseudorhodoplanes sp.]